MINRCERIKIHNVRFHLLSLLNRHLNPALRLTFLDKLDIVFLHQLLITAVFLQLRDLLPLRLIIRDLLLEISHLVIAVLQENFLFFVFSSEVIQLLRILVLAGACFTPLMHHNDEADDIKLLLVDAVLIKEPLLIEFEELLFEAVLNIDDFIADVFELELPRFALFVFEFFFFLEPFTVAGTFFIGHFFVGFVHPLFFGDVELSRGLFLFEDKFTTHHHLDTTSAHSVTFEFSFTLETSSFFFSETVFILLGQVLLNLNLRRINLENTFRVFKLMSLRLKLVNLLSQIRLQLLDSVHLFLNLKQFFFFILLQKFKLIVEIPLQLKDNFFDHLDLGAFTLISVQLERFIQ